jgi:DHA3 family macrolide efflux protein-like MFS transporter
MLPQVFLGPFIGAMVDRWNRQRVMILSDAIIALITLGLAVLFLTGQIQYWHLYVTALVRGVLGVFHWTAMQASTSLLVPKDQLARVAGMNQTLQGILNIAAPPLGALVVGLLPMGPIMLIDVVTAGVAILPLLFAHIPQPKNITVETVTPKRVLLDVRDGLRYVRAFPGMIIVLLLATLVNFLLTPTGTLTPLLVTRHFGGGAWHLSALESVFGVGIIAGGLLLATWGGFKKRIFTSMIALGLNGIGVLLVALAPSDLFFMALVGNTLSGILLPLVNGPLFALLQDKIAPEMQGRVFTLVSSLAGAMSPLGLALAAPVSDALGIQTWWLIGGTVCLVLGPALLAIRSVRGIEEALAPEITIPKVEPVLAK